MEDSLAQLKLRDAALGVGGTGEQGKRRSLDRLARQQELRHLANNFGNLPLDEYIGFVLAFYNYD